MKHKAFRRLLSAVLLAALLLALMGCGKKDAAEAAPAAPQQTDTQPEKPAAQKPAATQKMETKFAPQSSTDAPAAQSAAQGTASLTALRAQMASYQPFAVAYLGFVGGLFDGGFDNGFPKWLAESDPRQLEENPFISEIDTEHIIGGVGHLYCIVPQDEAASLAVNRVHWDGAALEYVVDEVAYRAESGEPILLFANLDGDESITDTVVTVVSENGDCEWYPALNADGTVMLPGDGVGDFLLDFTQYADVGVGKFGDWLVHGWLGPTALSLAGAPGMGGQMWSVGAMLPDGRSAYFALTFYPESDTGGQVDFNWAYDEQLDEYEEMWSGFWTLQTAPDQPSYVTLDLSRVGGLNYDSVDGPYYFSETYPLLLAPSGESLILAAGEHDIVLPGMPESTDLIELLLAVG